MDDYDKRIRQLEDQYKELLLKGKVLAWIGGGLLSLLTLLGFSLPALLKSAIKRVHDASEKQISQSLDADLEKARQATADLEVKIAQANNIGSSSPRSIVDPSVPKHNNQVSAPHLATLTNKSRTERQIDAFSNALKLQPDGRFTPVRLTDDIGQLVNSVDIFIADMQAHNLKPDYAGVIPETYKSLNHLSVDTRNHVASYDDPAHDSGSQWHSSDWFAQFDDRLRYMELTHRQEGTLTSEELDKWKAQFELVRKGLWGRGASVVWPEPLAP